MSTVVMEDEGDYGRMKNFGTSRLKSVALVAYGKDFLARTDLMKIGLYKEDISE